MKDVRRFIYLFIYVTAIPFPRPPKNSNVIGASSKRHSIKGRKPKYLTLNTNGAG